MKTLICQNPNCGKEFEVYPYRVKTAKFCCKACGSSVNKNRWKGGKIVNAAGYVLIRVDNKYVYEHRLVMEKLLGRKLKSNETVHHKKENDKKNNNPKNLKLIKKQKHDSMETKMRWDKNPESFEGEERCNAPRIGRKGSGKFCQRWKPCAYHKDND